MQKTFCDICDKEIETFPQIVKDVAMILPDGRGAMTLRLTFTVKNGNGVTFDVCLPCIKGMIRGGG